MNYEPDAQWPPAPYDEMLESMHTWSAWWAGDVDRLTDIYSSKTGHRSRRYGPRGREIKGDKDVFFWGRPNPQGTKRRHVTTPASVARASAGLLFSKAPRMSPGPEDEKNKELADRIDKIFGPDAYGGELIAAGEMCSALGGVYLRPWWDKEVVGHVVPSHVAADCAIPEFRFDRLIAVTFWTVVSGAGETPILRHLERHEKGKIIHALYSGTENNLGEELDLADHYATEWITKINADGVVETGLDMLDVVYVPNVLPNRTWHDVPGLAPLGRSDFDGIEAEFDALDEVQTSWMRDVQDAKSRLLIDETMMDDLGPGRGAAFDEDAHLFKKLKAGIGSATDGGAPIIDIKFDIRWNEHAQTSAEIKQHILDHVGISSQHFADGPLAVGVTATEVTSRNSITETTRAAKINFWQRSLTQFVEIVMKLDAIHFDTGLELTSRPTVRFATQHTLSEAEIAANIQTKRAAGVMSQEEGVKAVNPDWTDAEVLEEVKKVREDMVRESTVSFGSYRGGPDDPAIQEGDLPDVTEVEGHEEDESTGQGLIPDMGEVVLPVPVSA